MALNRLLIDTSAYSAFRRGHEVIVRTIAEADAIFVSATVLGELLAGFAGGHHRNRNTSELESFLTSPRVDFVDLDEETAQRYAVIYDDLRATGSLIPTNDIWIAASAMQHGLQLLTLDAHFTRISQIMTVPLGPS